MSNPDVDLVSIKEQYETRILKLDVELKQLQRERDDFAKKLELAEKSKTKTKSEKSVSCLYIGG